MIQNFILKQFRPIKPSNPLIHYLNYGQKRQLPTRPLEHKSQVPAFKLLRQFCRRLIFAYLSFIHAFVRSKIDSKNNYDHQVSAFKFWKSALERVHYGRPSEVRFTVPSYLMQPQRWEPSESHVHRVLNAPLQCAHLYLANVFKTQGYFADAEYILQRLSKQPAVRDLALCSLGDLLLVQARWAHEFEMYSVDGIALNPFSQSKQFAESLTWHRRTFKEALTVIEQAVIANEQNTDAQWLLCYGKIFAGDYAGACKSLRDYRGRSSEVSERNLLESRSIFGLNAEEGISLRKEFFSGLDGSISNLHLQLVNMADIPAQMVQEHIKVIEATKLAIHSKVVRNRELISFDNTLQFTDSYLARLNDAQIIPEYGLLVAGEHLLVKDTAHVKPCHMPVFHSSIQEVTAEGAFISMPRPIILKEENCIYLGVNRNFYHWIIDDLPRLSLVERSGLFSDAPILVEQNMSKWQYELFNILGVESGRLRKVDFGKPVSFRNLIVPSRLSRDMVAHPEAVSFLRKRLLDRTDHKATGGKRIYLERTKAVTANRRMLNERNVRDKFKRANFQIIDSGVLSIRQQIELFSDADVIAGPGGSALTNILFGPKGARVLSLGSSDILCETFTSIATVIGQESWSVRGRSYARSYPDWVWTNFNYEIDEKDIDFCFERIL